MNCSVNNGGRGERAHEQTVLRRSVEVEPILVPQQLTIDENLLVDPNLLFIGSKIGEGAHGKVYEGRSVSIPCQSTIYAQLSCSLLAWCD